MLSVRTFSSVISFLSFSHIMRLSRHLGFCLALCLWINLRKNSHLEKLDLFRKTEYLSICSTLPLCPLVEFYSFWRLQICIFLVIFYSYPWEAMHWWRLTSEESTQGIVKVLLLDLKGPKWMVQEGKVW